MTKVCNKCASNEISELVWVNQITGEIDQREDQYYCHFCKAKVDIVVTEEEPLSWIEDAKIVE